MSRKDRQRILDQLFFFGPGVFRPYLFRYLTLLFMSVTIAAFGLHANASAVVIGAMLVAPLMTSLLATAAAIVMGWDTRLWKTLVLLGSTSLAALVLAIVLGTLLPDRLVIPSEILARTSPTLIDLCIALAAGLVGAYTLARQELSALPGVAIAVALVPPLTVVGLMLEQGQFILAGGALLLFGTNFVAIIVAASGVFLVTGFTPRTVIQRSKRKIGASLVGDLLGVALISVLLVWHGIQEWDEAEAIDETAEAVQVWLEDTDLEVVQIEVEEERVTIDVTSPLAPPSANSLAEAVKAELGEERELLIRWVQRSEQRI